VSAEVTLLNTWGTCEIAADATVAEFQHGMSMSGDGLAPIGIAIANVTVLVLDPETWQPVPCGEAGELFVCGACLANGYLNRPEEDKERFVTLSDGARAFRTGDCGKMDSDGVLTFLGRKDQQVKINGQRVELLEVELALINALRFSGASDAKGVVVATKAAEGLDARLFAFVAPSGNPNKLRTEMLTELPPAWVPQAVYVLQELPMLPTGKVDRLELQARAQQRSNTVPQMFQAPDSLGRIRDVGEDSLFALRTLKVAYLAAIMNVMLSHWLDGEGDSVWQSGVWMDIFHVGLGANHGLHNESYWTWTDTSVSLCALTYGLWAPLLFRPATWLLNPEGVALDQASGCLEKHTETWFLSWYIFVRLLFIVLSSITNRITSQSGLRGALHIIIIFTSSWALGSQAKGWVDDWFYSIAVPEPLVDFFCVFWWPFFFLVKMIMYLAGFHVVAPAMQAMRRFSPESSSSRVCGLAVTLAVFCGLMSIPGMEYFEKALWDSSEGMFTYSFLAFATLIGFSRVNTFLVACSFAPSLLASLGQLSFAAYVSHGYMGAVV
jgi:hypothetical protein